MVKETKEARRYFKSYVDYCWLSLKRQLVEPEKTTISFGNDNVVSPLSLHLASGHFPNPEARISSRSN